MKWFVCVLAFGFAVNMPGWAAKMGKEKQPKTPPLHHLVDIAVPDSMQLDSRLPLQTDRMLKCPVCHGIEDIDKQDFAKIDKKHPDFLRDGPYPDLNQFCYRCHDEEKHRRPNIHDMLDAEGKPKEEYCRYCHREVMQRLPDHHAPDGISRRHRCRRKSLPLRFRINLNVFLDSLRLNVPGTGGPFNGVPLAMIHAIMTRHTRSLINLSNAVDNFD